MKTTHRIEAASGRSLAASVEHQRARALQLDFYIPSQLWEVPEAREFFRSVAGFGGATVFEREQGIWNGDQEKTDVVRVLVRLGDVDARTVRKQLRQEVGRLLVSLSASPEFAQEVLMYTETLVTVVTASNVKRLG